MLMNADVCCRPLQPVMQLGMLQQLDQQAGQHALLGTTGSFDARRAQFPLLLLLLLSLRLVCLMWVVLLRRRLKV
jgi:hypothetical protein